MKHGVRTMIEMGIRALGFSRANPSPDAGYGQLVLRLEDATGRAVALVTQQRAGSIAAEAATERRGEIRLGLHDNLLRHLVTVGKDVAKEAPGLTQHFKLPSVNATNLEYLNAAQAMYDEAVAERERFIRHGLADKLIDDLGAASRSTTAR